MNPELLKDLVIKTIEDLKASNIKVIDVRGNTSITDLMIICSGTSNRHVKSIAENVCEQAKKQGMQPVGMEGLDEGEWALIDLGDIIVHVMQPAIRDFYNLEGLWTITEQKISTHRS
jgi:ribosome-associated protein